MYKIVLFISIDGKTHIKWSNTEPFICCASNIGWGNIYRFRCVCLLSILLSNWRGIKICYLYMPFSSLGLIFICNTFSHEEIFYFDYGFKFMCTVWFSMFMALNFVWHINNFMNFCYWFCANIFISWFFFCK